MTKQAKAFTTTGSALYCLGFLDQVNKLKKKNTNSKFYNACISPNPNYVLILHMCYRNILQGVICYSLWLIFILKLSGLRVTHEAHSGCVCD